MVRRHSGLSFQNVEFTAEQLRSIEDKLKPEHRLVLHAAQSALFAIKTYAGMRNVADNTIKTRLHRARKAANKLLAAMASPAPEAQAQEATHADA